MGVLDTWKAKLRISTAGSTYRPGDAIQGAVLVDVKKPLSVAALKLRMRCVEEVDWMTNSGHHSHRHVHKSKHYLNEAVLSSASNDTAAALMKAKITEPVPDSAAGQTTQEAATTAPLVSMEVPTGDYSFPFSMTIPRESMPSVEKYAVACVVHELVAVMTLADGSVMKESFVFTVVPLVPREAITAADCARMQHYGDKKDGHLERLPLTASCVGCCGGPKGEVRARASIRSGVAIGGGSLHVSVVVDTAAATATFDTASVILVRRAKANAGRFAQHDSSNEIGTCRMAADEASTNEALKLVGILHVPRSADEHKYVAHTAPYYGHVSSLWYEVQVKVTFAGCTPFAIAIPVFFVPSEEHVDETNAAPFGIPVVEPVTEATRVAYHLPKVGSKTELVSFPGCIVSTAAIPEEVV